MKTLARLFIRWLYRRRCDRIIWLRDADGRPYQYLTRYYIFESDLFGVFLHRFHAGDFMPSRPFHDHPWHFVSIGLAGLYLERFPNGPMCCMEPGKIHLRPAQVLHGIASVAPAGACWTLVIHFRRHRKWGFINSEGRWVCASDDNGGSHVRGLFPRVR